RHSSPATVCWSTAASPHNDASRRHQMVTPTEDYYPDHDGGKFAPIAATTVAMWKAPACLENLAIDAEGAVFVTVYSHKRVDRYDPAARDVGPAVRCLRSQCPMYLAYSVRALSTSLVPLMMARPSGKTVN